MYTPPRILLYLTVSILLASSSSEMGSLDSPTLGLIRQNRHSFPRPPLRYTPIGRMAVPKDIAAMALYLAADESAMCTGQNYSVDGGVENCFDKQYGR